MDMTNEHFIVWMRTAGLPSFRKLWGRIEGPDGIKAGDYTIEIDNNYDVSKWKGQKKLVLSTTNALGGKNYFLGTCYLVVGAVSLLFSLVFMAAYCKKKKANA